MADAYITGLAAAGTLTGDELLEVSQLSSTVTYTATTLSAQASDNSFNDSAAQFVAEGFASGDRVRVAGFTGNAANNILVGVITALTTTKMTIGGTDGDVIVDDAAGESVTISKWVSRRTTADDIAALASGTASRTLIGEITCNSVLTTFTFSSISAAYKGLELDVCTIAGDAHTLRFNNDSSGVNGSTGLYSLQKTGHLNGALNAQLLSQTSAQIIASMGYANMRARILNYNLATAKIAAVDASYGWGGSGGIAIQPTTVRWADNTAINRIDLICGSAPTGGYVRLFGLN